MLMQIRLAIEHPNGSDARSEEDGMSRRAGIALTTKGAKLMKLCDLEGFKRVQDLLQSAITDSICPAICMTEGCEHTAEMEPDQDQGYCEACGGNTMVSALVLVGVI
jgi:hypothetical protein